VTQETSGNVTCTFHKLTDHVPVTLHSCRFAVSVGGKGGGRGGGMSAGGAGAGSTCACGVGGGDGANDGSDAMGTSALAIVEANVTDLRPVQPLKALRPAGEVVLLPTKVPQIWLHSPGQLKRAWSKSVRVA
jgi:hypothetical protein